MRSPRLGTALTMEQARLMCPLCERSGDLLRRGRSGAKGHGARNPDASRSRAAGEGAAMTVGDKDPDEYIRSYGEQGACPL